MAAEHKTSKSGFFYLLGLWNYLFLTLLVFFLIFAGASVTGHRYIAIIAIFAILGILSRMPAARSPYDFSFVNVFTLLLSIINFWAAAVFAIGTWWLARYWNPMEEMTNTIKWSLSVFLPALLSPLFIGFSGGNLVTYSIHFTIIRFILLMAILSPLVRPATLVNDLAVDFTEIFFSIAYNVALVMLFGAFFLDYFNISGWQVGGISDLINFFTGIFRR